MLITNKVAEVTVNYFPKKFTSKIKIIDSKSAYDIFKELWSDKIFHVEQFYVLLLNSANYVIGYNCLATGGTRSVVVDVKVILQLAITTNASRITVAHNHPSTQLKASKQDLDLTQKLKNALKLMDIELLDHLILTGEDNYYSFADEGLL